MKKITFLTLHLGYGGIENAITTLSNSLVNDFEIEIISVYKRFDEPVFKLNKNINVKYLFKHSDIKYVKEKNILKFFKNFNLKNILKIKEKNLVKNIIKNLDTDILISTNNEYNNVINKYCPKKILKIVWEHDSDGSNKYINKSIKSLENIDYLVLVSNTLQEFYTEKMNNNNCKCIYIPNALETFPSEISKLDSNNILTIGKLSKEKGYVDLIETFKYVSLKYPDWKLNIVGDGVERKKIEEKIKLYKLENNVFVHGFKDKKFVSKMLSKSSIFVMTSYAEAFGNVILEAFSYGIPCVAFDDSLGAKEIISNNWDGYLISNMDKEKMVKKILDLIKNENRRTIMGNNARKKSLKYDIDVIREKWIEILK